MKESSGSDVLGRNDGDLAFACRKGHVVRVAGGDDRDRRRRQQLEPVLRSIRLPAWRHRLHTDVHDFATLQKCYSGEGEGLAAGCEGLLLDANCDGDVDLDDACAFLSALNGPGGS